MVNDHAGAIRLVDAPVDRLLLVLSAAQCARHARTIWTPRCRDPSPVCAHTARLDAERESPAVPQSPHRPHLPVAATKAARVPPSS
eukprot:19455-Prymnesium_polylepis.2